MRGWEWSSTEWVSRGKRPELKANEADLLPGSGHSFSSHAQLNSDLTSHEVENILSIHASVDTHNFLIRNRNARLPSPGPFLTVLFWLVWEARTVSGKRDNEITQGLSDNHVYCICLQTIFFSSRWCRVTECGDDSFKGFNSYLSIYHGSLNSINSSFCSSRDQYIKISWLGVSC